MQRQLSTSFTFFLSRCLITADTLFSSKLLRVAYLNCTFDSNWCSKSQKLLIMSRRHALIAPLTTTLYLSRQNFQQQISRKLCVKWRPQIRDFPSLPTASSNYKIQFSVRTTEKEFSNSIQLRDGPQMIISWTRMIITGVINRSLGGISFAWWNVLKRT